MPYLRPDGKTQVTIEYDGDKPVRLDTVVVSTPARRRHRPRDAARPGHRRATWSAPELADARHRHRRLPAAGQPDRPVRDRRPDGRRRPDRPQDHRRHLRRHGPPRRRRVLRQGPVQGRPLGRLRDALGGQERRRGRARRPVRGAGGVRDRQGRAGRACSSRPSAPRRSPVERIQDAIAQVFDLRPAAIIRDLDLLRPIYAQTAAYGHFGRELPDFTWERTDRADALRAACWRVTSAGGAASGNAPQTVAPKEQDSPATRLPVARSRRCDISPRSTWTVPSTTWCRRATTSKAVPGSRVRVRFAGRLVDGYLLERAETSDHQGRLAYLDRVVGRAGAVARDRRPGPRRRRPVRRHARRRGPAGRPAPACQRRERAAASSPGTARRQAASPGTWRRYPAGRRRSCAPCAEGRPVRAVWSALPGADWPAEIAARRPPRRRHAAWSSSSPTPATWPGSTPRSAERGRRATSR